MTLWSAEIKELEKLYESIIGQLPDLEKELGQLIHFDDPNVIMLYSRRCLEVIITDLCECELKRPRKTEPLKGIIDKLHKEEIVPSHIVSSMYGLNELSTYGTHPKDFDPEQVKPVLNNLDIIIKWYLKYKDTKVNLKAEVEGVKDKVKIPDDNTELIRKPKKSLILLLSGLTLVVAIVVTALFVFDVIGGGNQIKELEKSIAVLPFIDDSPDENNSHIINGLMDEILINLQKISDLLVSSRNSVEQFRGENKPSTPDIARKLGVNYIVEGSGQKYGNKLRLRVQLIVVSKGKEKHLWGKVYENEITKPEDYFDIQSEVAESIADELKAIMTPEEQQLIEKIPTKNLDAYYAYMRGNYEYSNRVRYGSSNISRPNIDALNRAEDLYHKALEYDPEYAQAYVGLANVYWAKNYSEEIFSENFMDSVLVLANKALSYDNNLAEAYSLRGRYYRYKGDYDRAIKEYEKTLDINTNYWQAYSGLADLYAYMRDPINTIKNYTEALKLSHDLTERHSLLNDIAFSYGTIGFYDKSIEYYKEKLKLDDDSLSYYGATANIARFNEKYSVTLQHYKRMHELNPGNNNLNANMATIYYILGQKETAAEWYKKYTIGLDTLGTSLVINYMHRVGFAYLVAGQPEKAEEYFKMEKRYCEESIKLNIPYAQFLNAYYDLACTFAIMGDRQNAYKNLHIYNDKIGDTEYLVMFWFLKTDLLLESIRNEPEFQEIYHEIETKYNNTHEKVRKWLEEQGML